ncbi:hypothetical protein [Chlorogloea sp. CCALA 695]|nr:hypothetical protein [Chlorogloea sp. CCALA 695]
MQEQNSNGDKLPLHKNVEGQKLSTRSPKRIAAKTTVAKVTP